MASLNGMNSNGVSQRVTNRVEWFRQELDSGAVDLDDPTDISLRFGLRCDMAVSRRDAE
jgi:hypothetical protein